MQESSAIPFRMAVVADSVAFFQDVAQLSMARNAETNPMFSDERRYFLFQPLEPLKG